MIDIKIYNEDCFKGLPLMLDNSVDLIIIDPPYLVTNQSWDKEDIINDELSNQLFRIAKNSCSLYVWCGIGEKSQSLIRWFPVFFKKWHFKDLITWKKQRGIGMRKGWLFTREEIMWFVKNNNEFVWNTKFEVSTTLRQKYGFKTKCKSEYKRLSNVWDDIKEVSFTGIFGKQKPENIREHFTPKPIEAIKRIIKVHTKENDLILDCFAGTGTIGVACKQLNRKCIMYEINPIYVDIAKKRLSQMGENSKTPTLN